MTQTHPQKLQSALSGELMRGLKSIATCRLKSQTGAIIYEPLQISGETRLPILERLDQLRDDLKQVAHNPVIRHFEDRSVRVLIDRHDGARSFHPHQVL